MERIINKISALAFVLLLLTSCGPHGAMTKAALHKLKPDHSYSSEDSGMAPDYGQSDSWLVSKDLDSAVDIFFVHPTSYKKPDYWNMHMDDTATIARTYRRSIRRILSVFDGLGNIYAPKYRQATFYAFVDTHGDGAKAIDVARRDVLRAFDYYLKNLNHGRPFILAAHSQGSLISMDILPIIYNDSALKKQLVAAWLVGWPIDREYLKNHPEIVCCEDSLQTGCIISWNTETEHSKASIVDKECLCVNPLDWTQSRKFVSADKNTGAVFFLYSKADTFPHYTGARCDSKGILRIPEVPNKEYLKKQYALGLLHRFDYQIFYLNTRHNAQLRIKEYFAN